MQVIDICRGHLPGAVVLCCHCVKNRYHYLGDNIKAKPQPSASKAVLPTSKNDGLIRPERFIDTHLKIGGFEIEQYNV